MKKILIISLVFLSTVSAHGMDTFEWVSTTYNGRVYDKAAILVPVKFQGIDKTYYAQLDTGADATIFYGNILKKI